MAEEVNQIQEILRTMNQNAGEEPPVSLKPVSTSAPVDTPAAPQPTQQTPEAPTPSTPAPDTTSKESKDYIPPDPEFVRRKNNAETPTPAQPAAQQTATPEPVADDLFYNRLSELTGGNLKDEQSFIGVLNHYNELLDEKQKGFQPQFENARAKWAYDLLTANPGKELEAAQRTVHALSLSEQMDKMPEKDLLFEAYLLDPNNSDLRENEARQYFDADFEKRFSDLENDVLQKRQLALDVRKAKEQISSIQSSYQATQAAPAQISKEVEDSIGQVVENFGGIKLSFTENPSDNEFLTVAIEDPNELARLRNNALHPDQWHQEFMSQFQQPDGSFDFQNYVRERYEMEHHREIRKATFDHAIKLGQLSALNKARNASNPKQIADLGTPMPGAPQPKSFADAWASAQKR